jgi:hypothetical protein
VKIKLFMINYDNLRKIKKSYEPHYPSDCLLKDLWTLWTTNTICAEIIITCSDIAIGGHGVSRGDSLAEAGFGKPIGGTRASRREANLSAPGLGRDGLESEGDKGV